MSSNSFNSIYFNKVRIASSSESSSTSSSESSSTSSSESSSISSSESSLSSDSNLDYFYGKKKDNKKRL